MTVGATRNCQRQRQRQQQRRRPNGPNDDERRTPTAAGTLTCHKVAVCADYHTIAYPPNSSFSNSVEWFIKVNESDVALTVWIAGPIMSPSSHSLKQRQRLTRSLFVACFVVRCCSLFVVAFVRCVRWVRWVRWVCWVRWVRLWCLFAALMSASASH